MTTKLSKAQINALATLTEDCNRCLGEPYYTQGWGRFPYNVHETVLKSLIDRGLLEDDRPLFRLTDAGAMALAESEASDG